VQISPVQYRYTLRSRLVHVDMQPCLQVRRYVGLVWASSLVLSMSHTRNTSCKHPPRLASPLPCPASVRLRYLRELFWSGKDDAIRYRGRYTCLRGLWPPKVDPMWLNCMPRRERSAATTCAERGNGHRIAVTACPVRPSKGMRCTAGRLVRQVRFCEPVASGDALFRSYAGVKRSWSTCCLFGRRCGQVGYNPFRNVRREQRSNLSVLDAVLRWRGGRGTTKFVNLVDCRLLTDMQV
jgi:hypothetical protein